MKTLFENVSIQYRCENCGEETTIQITRKKWNEWEKIKGKMNFYCTCTKCKCRTDFIFELPMTCTTKDEQARTRRNEKPVTQKPTTKPSVKPKLPKAPTQGETLI